MTQELQEAPENELIAVENWKIKYLVGGVLAGALVGLGAAYLFTQNYERRGEQAEITLWQGVRIGILALSLMRSLAALGDE
jgi:hypothetical protein